MSDEDLDVRLHAAAASAALRVLNEDIGVLEGADPRDHADAPARIARAVRRTTGGAVGDPVTT
ncbi:hypothetical protein [Streptomyces ureilyticus]|uniref:hypothetical protein n=1 Tax=Streptomyces ureilyticus TaxID=1775131 RepID=UPI001F4127A9|nr:hypothetical protein [Streptomyces ureilyticus]